jgi:Fe-S cluster biogenesis protein NfuA
MTNSLDAREFQSRLQRLDALLLEVERWMDPAAQAQARELVQIILDLHGAGMERILAHLDAAAQDACARDEVAAGLLLLHGLHPLDLEARVHQALDDVRPALRGHGGDVQLVSVTDGVVRLRLEGNCHGCPSSVVTMRQTVEEAIVARAPDAAAVEVEGLAEEAAPPASGGRLVALPLV